jgi:hypothetical protein
VLASSLTRWRLPDALELSAAIVAAELHPAMLPLVTRDEPLTRDAEREGSPSMRPTQAPLISSSRLLPRQPNPRRTTRYCR